MSPDHCLGGRSCRMHHHADAICSSRLALAVGDRADRNPKARRHRSNGGRDDCLCWARLDPPGRQDGWRHRHGPRRCLFHKRRSDAVHAVRRPRVDRASQGRWEPPSDTAQPTDATPGSPATLPPGTADAANLAFNWANWCGANPGPMRVRITFSGGGTVTGPFDGPPLYDFVPRCDNSSEPSSMGLLWSFMNPTP